ncbi:hypothetical protein ES708_11668 [subsurface metagenome]
MGAEVKLTFHTEKVVRKIEDTASKKMAEAVNVVRNTVLETLSGSRSGRTYRVPGTKRTYTASSPGKPPAQATGRLRQSIKTSVGGEGRTVIGKVGTTLDYGKYLEFGTRGGAVIRPRTAKVLAFFVDGQDVFATQVIQGPIAPRPWLKPSFEKAVPKVKNILGKKWF